MGKLSSKLRRDPMTTTRHRINAGRVAVQQQVDFFRRQFGCVASDWKADDTRVTFADFAISEKLFAELRGSFPHDDFCSEESSPEDELLSLEAEFCWVLDPIDGTNNYYFGLPMCAISLALLRKGEPIYGFVYDLARDTLVEGGPDFGLMDGSAKAKVKTAELDPHSIIGLHFPLNANEVAPLGDWMQTYRVRSFGSSTLAITYAALGKIDGCLDSRVKVWDIAAAYALVKGGGGDFHWFDEPAFPMQDFKVDQPKLRFAAGSLSFVTEAKKLNFDA
ncbi:inositol monophosphatase family protein [Cerasicoccus maritimus]|uniref:inositol monophosphatase family protein n=1 Tax=Cerasicoccus maritimus TaxID=490089 RepID=UPI002852CC9F|nr:inositol monophosphatase [Cerasicoccus maritimus]